MEPRNTGALGDVAAYYASTFASYGETPRGVDWNGAESQRVRFDQLNRVISPKKGLSVIDLGCGYGALFDYLYAQFPELLYEGYDICAPMIDAARLRLDRHNTVRLSVAAKPSNAADYALASGIFNVRLDRNPDDWHHYILSTLDILNAASRCGFAFNALTTYSDAEKKRDHLHYSDPCVLFDYCKRRYSRNVALLHDYGLYEFTLIVRK